MSRIRPSPKCLTFFCMIFYTKINTFRSQDRSQTTAIFTPPSRPFRPAPALKHLRKLVLFCVNDICPLSFLLLLYSLLRPLSVAKPTQGVQAYCSLPEDKGSNVCAAAHGKIVRPIVLCVGETVPDLSSSPLQPPSCTPGL